MRVSSVDLKCPVQGIDSLADDTSSSGMFIRCVCTEYGRIDVNMFTGGMKNLWTVSSVTG